MITDIIIIVAAAIAGIAGFYWKGKQKGKKEEKTARELKDLKLTVEEIKDVKQIAENLRNCDPSGIDDKLQKYVRD